MHDDDATQELTAEAQARVEGGRWRAPARDPEPIVCRWPQAIAVGWGAYGSPETGVTRRPRG